MFYHEEEDQDLLNTHWISAISKQFGKHKVVVDEPLRQGMNVYEGTIEPFPRSRSLEQNCDHTFLWIRARGSETSDWGPWSPVR